MTDLGSNATETLTNVLRDASRVRRKRPELKITFDHYSGEAGDNQFLLQLKLNGDTTHSTLVSRTAPFKWTRFWFWKKVLLHRFVNTLYKKGYIQNIS